MHSTLSAVLPGALILALAGPFSAQFQDFTWNDRTVESRLGDQQRTEMVDRLLGEVERRLGPV